MWNRLKNFISRTWTNLKKFVMKHLHKAVAVAGSGIVAVTIEVFGFMAADLLLMPLAMVSIFGLLGLCFAYFCVGFAAITAAIETFSFLWEKCQFSEVNIKVTEAVFGPDHATDAEMAAAMAGVNA